MGMCVALNLNVKGVRVYIREGVHTLKTSSIRQSLGVYVCRMLDPSLARFKKVCIPIKYVSKFIP